MKKTCALLLLFVGSTWVIGNPVPAPCPIEIIPASVVVEYGRPVTANCSTSLVSHDGMGWEASSAATDMEEKLNFVIWTVASLKDWTVTPRCYINFPDRQCEDKLSITVYKLPDSITISQLDHFGPLVAGNEYKFQCYINSVAPVQKLTVNWYKGSEIIWSQSNFTEQLNDLAPANVFSVHTIRVDQLNNAEQIHCKAALNLSSEELSLTSEKLQMTVYYPPVFLSPKEESFDVVKGDSVTIDCSASGNPSPKYTFGSSTIMEIDAIHTSVLPPGNYVCNASNEVGSISKHFTIKEAASDSPGTIAGIVVIILIILSVSVVLIWKRCQNRRS